MVPPTCLRHQLGICRKSPLTDKPRLMGGYAPSSTARHPVSSSRPAMRLRAPARHAGMGVVHHPGRAVTPILRFAEAVVKYTFRKPFVGHVLDQQA